VSLWDPNSREVMTELQREKLFTDHRAQRPQFHEGLKRIEMKFEIAPGEGVHHPFIAPHVVVNGQEPSVSWAITFRTRGSDAKGYVHRVNHLLRRAGLQPTPQGESKLGDWLKSRGFWAAKRAVRIVRPSTNDTPPCELPPGGTPLQD